jgi:hypothetical protein
LLLRNFFRLSKTPRAKADSDQVSVVRMGSVINLNELFYYCTEHFMDLGKLNLFMVVHFRIEPIFTATALDALKNNAQFKSGQN